MQLQKKWLPVVSLALGLPSTILFSAIFLLDLVKKGIISQFFAVIIFLAIIIHIILIMVIYAVKRKNRP